MYERMAVMRIICLSFASLALLFTVMLIGTYVDASHQGLSCPDWPLCPNGFNIPPKKYLFEQIHSIIAENIKNITVCTELHCTYETHRVTYCASALAIVE